MDLVISGTVPVGGELRKLDIGVDGGVIRAVGKSLNGSVRHDFGDRLLLPGAVDLHVHLREPGRYPGIGFESETRGAVLAGVTTVFDMPNNEPPTSTDQAYSEKRALAAGKSHCDIGFYWLVRSKADIPKDVYPGGFKVYLGPSTNANGFDWSCLRALDECASVRGRPIMVHPEEPSLFDESVDASSLTGYDARRPVACEKAAVERFATAVQKSRAHFCHVTSTDSFPAGNFTFEATHHHLLLSSAMPLGAEGKVLPPLRSEHERARLWNAFAEGRVPCLASDHAPHPADAKARPFADAPSGIPSLGAGFPVMLGLALSGRLDLSTLVECACANPAAIMGLRKGSLEVGMDADVVVVDPARRSKVPAGGLSGCGHSPFSGWDAVYPSDVFIRGERVVEDGRLAGPPRGRVMA